MEELGSNLGKNLCIKELGKNLFKKPRKKLGMNYTEAVKCLLILFTVFSIDSFLVFSSFIRLKAHNQFIRNFGKEWIRKQRKSNLWKEHIGILRKYHGKIWERTMERYYGWRSWKRLYGINWDWNVRIYIETVKWLPILFAISSQFIPRLLLGFKNCFNTHPHDIIRRLWSQVPS